jgi:hypothetical protein
MTAVAVELLTRPPAAGAAPVPAPALPAIEPYAVELIADTDTLLTMCSCSSSSSAPYNA